MIQERASADSFVSQHRANSDFFNSLLNDTFHEPSEGSTKGLDALKKVRDEDPATYARIFAALMPKQVEITDEDPISNLTDEQLEAYCAELEAKSRNAPREQPPRPSPPPARSG